jgi:hypothetical protein
MGEEPSSNSGNDPDIARRIAQERRIAREQRRAYCAEEERWTDIAGALKIQGTDNPADLVAALASGKVQHHFQHPARWWVSKPVPPRLWKEGAISGNKLIGPNGTSLENEHQELRINKQDWRDYLGRSAALALPADVPPPVTEKERLRNAPAAEIRKAIKAEYSEAKTAGQKPPNINEIRPRVQERLKAQGFYASQAHIARIGKEFGKRRIKRGRTWKSKKKISRAKSTPKKCPPNANFSLFCRTETRNLEIAAPEEQARITQIAEHFNEHGKNET